MDKEATVAARLSSPVYRFGVFQADPRSGELFKKGARVRLQDKPFQLLLLLLQAGGRVVTRDELREKLWNADTFVEFDDSLNAAVRKLRFALGDSAEHPRFLETVPKVGYRFIVPVGASAGAGGANGVVQPRVEEPVIAPPGVAF